MTQKTEFWGMNENNECYTTKAESDKLIEYLLENDLVNQKTKIWLPVGKDI